MKKALLIVTALLLAAIPVFAQSTVSLELPDELELVFRYENADAESVNIAGGFQGWDQEATPMEEVEEGVWEYRLAVSKSDNLTFKYVVDGEYLSSMEGLAPATTEDGFGGKNGVVAVAELAAAGGEEDDVFRTSLTFGTFTQLYSKTNFLTTSIAPGEDGEYMRGFETSNSDIVGKSYWKLTAGILPGIDTFLELKVFDGSIRVYEQAADATADPENQVDRIVTAADGLENVASALFSPFYSIGGDSRPEIGHFKAGLATGVVELSTGYNFAKSDESSRARIWQTFANDRDANDGYLEITNGEKIQTLGTDVGLDAMIGLTKRAGGHGIYSWVDVMLNDLTATVFYNSLANRLDDNQLRYYGFDAMHTIGLGTDIAIADLMDISVEAMTTLDPVKAYDPAEAIAAGFDGSLGLGDIFNTGFYARWAGSDVTTIFGDDNEGTTGAKLAKGVFLAGISPSTKPIDLLKVGVNYDFRTNHLFDGDALITNEWYSDSLTANTVHNLYPYIDLYLGSVLPVTIDVSGYSAMTLTTGPSDFSVRAAGGSVALKEIVPVLANVKLGYDYYKSNDDWGQIYGKVELTELAEGLDYINVDLAYLNENIVTVAHVGLAEKVKVDTSVVVRLADGETSPFGVALGGELTLPENWRGATTFLRMGYDLAPYSGDDATADVSFDGNYPDSLGGQGEAFLSFGIGWDF